MRVFGIGKATLPAVVKTLVVPELRSSRPSALAPWFHQHRAPAVGPFCLHWQPRKLGLSTLESLNERAPAAGRLRVKFLEEFKLRSYRIQAALVAQR